MYQFERYDPKVPRMVTSFKGNQKLIFEGYRYNIHHLIPAKNAKTWRCVCAKKLTSDRSWCKGRAESYDNDTRGVGKGDHNHEPEHGAAELEYFKSQLIMAAIECPDTPLNELIAEAKRYMNEGLDFPSKDSLKKSLTMARKSSENGGFKFRNYKTSGGTGVKSTKKKESTNESSNNFPALLDSIMSNTPKREADSTINALLSLSKSEESKTIENNNTIQSLFPEKPINDSVNNALLAQLATFHSLQNNNSSLIDNINLLKQFQMTALAAAVTGTPVKSTPPVKRPRKVPTTSSTGNVSSSKAKTSTPKSSRSSTSTNPSMAPSLLSSPSSSINVEQQQQSSSIVPPSSSSSIESGNSMQQKKDSMDMAIRANRLTDIFNRISERALAKATSPTNTQSSGTSTNGEEEKLEAVVTRTIGTQTENDDQSLDEESLIENNKCIAKKDCDCRTIKVCCCSTKGCVRKRKSEEISC
uniref:FLYWCH-type domain-containing protein n=1 Tax=Strongyloides papillosus TaxID=174720 RepID=A0A0N5CB08_STREA